MSSPSQLPPPGPVINAATLEDGITVNQINQRYSLTTYVGRVINVHIIYLTTLLTAKFTIDILNFDLFNLWSPLFLNHLIFHPPKI